MEKQRFPNAGSKVGTAGTCQNGVFTCFVTEEQIERVKAGMTINVEGESLSVSEISGKPAAVTDETDPYLLYLDGFSA